VRIGDTTRSDYLIMLECFVLPYFGMRKAESLTRLNIEQFRSDMSEGLPGACRLAREAKLKELQNEGPECSPEAIKEPGSAHNQQMPGSAGFRLTLREKDPDAQ
jgi:hypothetical protein